MIKMEIEMNEKKIREDSEYTVEQIKSMVEEVAEMTGISKKDNKGAFLGNGNNQDFANFGSIVLYLKEQQWFLPFVKKWILYVDDEIDDLAKHYQRKAV